MKLHQFRRFIFPDQNYKDDALNFFYFPFPSKVMFSYVFQYLILTSAQTYSGRGGDIWIISVQIQKYCGIFLSLKKLFPPEGFSSQRVFCSNVKATFFQDGKLLFCCFCSKKDRIYSFLKQNSGSKQKVFSQYQIILVQKLLFWYVSKTILGQLKVLLCL